MIELGFFGGERLELLDGVLAVREPQGSRHATGVRLVMDTLRAALGSAWRVDSQLPIALDDESEPEPDVSVVPAGPRLYRDAHPSAPRLVVEIAESSYRIDRHYKSSLYARAGVPEYWIVDVVNDRVEVHREREASSEAAVGWRYRNVVVLDHASTVTPLVAPGVTIAAADLLP